MKLNNQIQSEIRIFTEMLHDFIWLRILLTVFFVLPISSLVTFSAYASPLIQETDPATQCSQGVQLYFDGDYSKALPLLEAGFANRDAIVFDNPDDLGICALALGSLLSPDDKALIAYQTALTKFQESGNKDMQGLTLNNLGTEYQIQGNYADALDSYLQARLIAQALGDKAGESITLNNIGLVYQSQGKYTNALDAFQRALVLAREVGDRENEGAVLNGIGMVYDSQGRYPEALELFQQALNIAQELGNRVREGITWNNIGAVYESQGRYVESLESYQRALGISLEADDQASERTMLNNIGQIYASQGRYAEALGYYEKALTISEELGDVASKGTTLNNIGQVFSAQGHYTEALAYFQEALTITQRVGNREVEGITLANIGLTYQAQNEYIQALESFKAALQIHQAIGDRESEGATLHNIGLVLKAQGQYLQALEYYQSALNIDREVGNREGEAVTLSHIGLIYELQGKNTEALEYYKNAIEVLETIRSSAGSETARSAFISKYSETYDRAVALYIKEGQPEEAFVASERGRSRAFLDSIATGHVELGDNESSTLYKNEQEAYDVRKNLQEALDLAKSQNPPDKNLIADLEEQIVLANAGYQASIDAITTRQDQLAQLVSGRKTVLDVKQVQALLDDQSILLSYWITDEQTFVFIVTRNSFDIVSLNLIHSDLSDIIESFTTFANIETSRPNSSIELYKSLIQPLKSFLNRPHLVIIPHRELHYIPFAAFSDGANYLLDDYMITYLPSASALPFIDENAKESGGTPLIMGNPATGNYDITSSLATHRDQLGPLPFAQEETEVIAKLLGVDPYTQINATETLVKQLARSTSILHFAAHGIFNPTAPLNSLVALAPDKNNDGWLTVSEVYGLDLSNADLIVLSACETQMGQLTAGDEFVGLTRAFFFAGTPTVIASLWSVEDKSTALLMEQFYAHRLEGMGKGEALRQAQIDTRKQYPNPYYWAGFVLSGDAGNDHRLISTPTEVITTEPSNIPCASVSLLLIVFMLYIRRK